MHPTAPAFPLPRRRPPTRDFGLLGLAIPRVKLERGDLSDGRQPLESVDLKIGLAVAEDRDEFEEIRHPQHGMALEAHGFFLPVVVAWQRRPG